MNEGSINDVKNERKGWIQMNWTSKAFMFLFFVAVHRIWNTYIQEQLLKLPRFIHIWYLLVTKAFKMITSNQLLLTKYLVRLKISASFICATSWTDRNYIFFPNVQGRKWRQDSQGLVFGWIFRNWKRRWQRRHAHEVATTNASLPVKNLMLLYSKHHSNLALT